MYFGSAVLAFDESYQQQLQALLEQLRAGEMVLDYHQLQGFLFAIACSPEPIKPSEWFELIWLNDDPQFEREEDAREFFRLVVALSEYVQQSLQQRRYLPFAGHYAAAQEPALAQWCDGFLAGHQYLEELWVLALDDLGDDDIADNVDLALSLAMTFAERAAARQLPLEQAFGLEDEHLPEAYLMFWRALDDYAVVAQRWEEGDGEPCDLEQLFLSLEPVARDEPCPCGSGEPFGRCCLH